MGHFAPFLLVFLLYLGNSIFSFPDRFSFGDTLVSITFEVQGDWEGLSMAVRHTLNCRPHFLPDICILWEVEQYEAHMMSTLKCVKCGWKFERWKWKQKGKTYPPVWSFCVIKAMSNLHKGKPLESCFLNQSPHCNCYYLYRNGVKSYKPLFFYSPSPL